ncbi:MAG: DUF128 domain-containing protein [Chitinispirillaceae bacterium]|nr:DUF128 domain-containing protein [Chitinispirillaceae bacterium]
MSSSKNVHITNLILRALHESGGAAGAATISNSLSSMGIVLHPRSIRYHLAQMDREGLTVCPARRKGRTLTELGKKELSRVDVIGRVGFVSAKVDELGYRMTLDGNNDSGTVIPNIVLVSQKDFERSIHFMTPVFNAGLGIGGRIAYKMYGEHMGGIMVPRGKIALATICSMTMNSLFIKAGIPITSRFGGLLEMKYRKPVRFVTMIDYKGTSIDPLKLFILAGMTDVFTYAQTGDGIIGASFREFPSIAFEHVRKLLTVFREKYDLGGVIILGRPGMPLLDVPVNEGRTAMVVLGGLNPVAALYERNVPAEIHPLIGLEEFSTFLKFEDVAPIGRRTVNAL